MKLFTLLFTLLTAAALAASWDGTHGNITISTIGDHQHTVVSVSDIDETVALFSVSITYKVPCSTVGCTPLTQTEVQYVSRIISKINPTPAIAIFSTPVNQVTGVFVAEFHAGQSESF